MKKILSLISIAIIASGVIYYLYLVTAEYNQVISENKEEITEQSVLLNLYKKEQEAIKNELPPEDMIVIYEDILNMDKYDVESQYKLTLLYFTLCKKKDKFCPETLWNIEILHKRFPKNKRVLSLKKKIDLFNSSENQ